MKIKMLMTITLVMLISVLSACGDPAVIDGSAESTEIAANQETVNLPEEQEQIESVDENLEQKAVVPEEHEHEWLAATLESPKVCAICGETEGEAVKCEELDLRGVINDDARDWDFVIPLADTIVCEKDAGGSLIEYAFYDYEGNCLSEGSKALDGDYWRWDIGVPEPLDPECKVGFEIALRGWDNNVYLTLFDRYGNIIKEDNFYYAEDGDVKLRICDDTRYLAHVNSYIDNKVINYIDLETMEIVDPSEEHALWWDREYDENTFEYFAKMSGKAQENIGGYIAKTADDTRWVFLDKEMNEVKSYIEATNFNIYGYALVSEDGTSFDIIDTDFNIIAKDFLQGEQAWLRPSTIGPGVVFTVYQDENSAVHYYIR